MDNVTISLIPSVGMIIVAISAVIYWRRISKSPIRWFWLGAGLWTVAVALKGVSALLTNKVAIGFMSENLSYPLLVLSGGLFLGIQSSFFEIGFILLAVIIWRQLGRDANRAIAIGIGAGAFEALLLGITCLAGIVICLIGLPGAEKVRESIDTVAAVTPLFWLIAPIERSIAILCHTSSRALVLLGVSNRKYMLVFWGFLIFTLLDGVAGAAHLSGKIGNISMWWIELAVLPFALISIPIIRWCYANWGRGGENRIESE